MHRSVQLASVRHLDISIVEAPLEDLNVLKAGNHCFRKRYFFQSMESEELSATLPWMEVGRLKRKLGSRSVRLIHSHSQKNTNSLSKYIPFHGGGKHTKDPSLVTIFC